MQSHFILTTALIAALVLTVGGAMAAPSTAPSDVADVIKQLPLKGDNGEAFVEEIADHGASALAGNVPELALPAE